MRPKVLQCGIVFAELYHRQVTNNETNALQAFHQGLSAPAPDHVGSVLTLAHFLDHMYHHRPAKRVEASPWYESATALVQQILTETVQHAPKVLLQ